MFCYWIKSVGGHTYGTGKPLTNTCVVVLCYWNSRQMAPLVLSSCSTFFTGTDRQRDRTGQARALTVTSSAYVIISCYCMCLVVVVVMIMVRMMIWLIMMMMLLVVNTGIFFVDDVTLSGDLQIVEQDIVTIRVSHRVRPLTYYSHT